MLPEPAANSLLSLGSVALDRRQIAQRLLPQLARRPFVTALPEHLRQRQVRAKELSVVLGTHQLRHGLLQARFCFGETLQLEQRQPLAERRLRRPQLCGKRRGLIEQGQGARGLVVRQLKLAVPNQCLEAVGPSGAVCSRIR